MQHTVDFKMDGKFHKPSRNRGVSLIIVMVFISAISGIAIWSVRQSILGEGMARNQMDLEVARQAAEAALRDAERDLMNLTPAKLTNASCTRSLNAPPSAPLFSSTCANGFCQFDESRYQTSNWKLASATNQGVAEPWWPTGKGGLWGAINEPSTATNSNVKPNRLRPTEDTKCAFSGGVPLGTYTGATPINGVAAQPEYLIEYFVRPSPISLKPTTYYRITTRGFGYRLRTQVVMQSFYAPL